MKYKIIAPLFFLFFSIAALSFLVAPKQASAFSYYGSKNSHWDQAVVNKIMSWGKHSYKWNIEITFKDLNGGAPRPGDLIEFTETAYGLPSDPYVGVTMISSAPQNAPFGNIQITQLPTCGAVNNSEYGFVIVTLKPRVRSGCSYTDSATVKFTTPLLSAPKGSLIERKALAFWFPDSSNCRPHNCWPYKVVTDIVRFKMGYVPYWIRAR